MSKRAYRPARGGKVFRRFPSLRFSKVIALPVNAKRPTTRFGQNYRGVITFYSKGGAAGGGGFYTTEEAKQLMRDNRKMGMRKTSFTMRRRNKP